MVVVAEVVVDAVELAVDVRHPQGCVAWSMLLYMNGAANGLLMRPFWVDDPTAAAVGSLMALGTAARTGARWAST